MQEQNNLDRIVYLSVPESLKGSIETASTDVDFSIDPAIPIPVELPPDAEKLNLENLSWEMILSGMMRVISQDPFAENAAYYRRFVLSVRPDIFNEFTEAAILKARNRDFDLALEIFAALQGLFPGSPVIMFNIALILEERAEILENAGLEEESEAEYEKAHTAYRELLSFEPPFPNSFFNAGFFYMKLKNFEKALECFKAYLPLADDDDKKAEAESIIHEIESRNLNDELFQEAYDCIRKGNEETGIQKARLFLERYPDVWNGWFMLGWGLRRLERWEDAAAAFRQAIELGSNNSDTRNELAICLMEMGDLKAARKELETALYEDPENIKIISNLGILALKNGDDDEAAAFFRTVLEIEPNDQLAAQYLAQF
ncbi:MAG: tetratricopeptide repeat protein [Treponema sp.]|jgi:tetratricopeptide (TPR) repeat protein|nr:tetratricopeptide repeat protein [Treponema sp.]